MEISFHEKTYRQMRKNLFLIDQIQHFKAIEKKKNASLERILLFLREHFMQALENVI
jgi:hypothetical protein